MDLLTLYVTSVNKLYVTSVNKMSLGVNWNPKMN